MLDKGEVEQLTSALREAQGALRGYRYGNQATITVSAGGIGVWIASTAAIVMLAVNMLLISVYVTDKQEMKSNINKMQDYLNAIYMQAPQLRPKEQEK